MIEFIPDLGLSNEVLFGGFLFGGLALALGVSYLGRIYLYTLMVAITIYINIAEAKVVEVFGFATTLGTVLFGVLYFATDLLNERYGKQAGFTAVKLGIFATIIFHLFMQATLQAQIIPDMEGDTFFVDFDGALDGVFTVSLRIVAASLAVYALIQTFDVWLFSKIKEKTGEGKLWLRNNVSTITSQGLDTVLFFFLAFYGTMPNAVIWEMVVVGFGFKVIVALCDTAFMYASKRFIPKDEAF